VFYFVVVGLLFFFCFQVISSSLASATNYCSFMYTAPLTFALHYKY